MLRRPGHVASLFGGLARGARAALVGVTLPHRPMLSIAAWPQHGGPSASEASLSPPLHFEQRVHALDDEANSSRSVAQRAAAALLPALTAAWTLLPGLIPSIVFVGKKSHRGKNKRMPKKCNHGARPCSHVMRRRRAAVIGRIKAKHR